MPSAFDQDFEETASADLLEVLGQEITGGLPGAEEPLEFVGIVEEQQSDGLVYEGWGLKDDRRAVLQVTAAVAASFVPGWVFTINSEVWNYCGELKREAGLVHAKIARPGISRLDRFRNK